MKYIEIITRQDYEYGWNAGWSPEGIIDQNEMEFENDEAACAAYENVDWFWLTDGWLDDCYDDKGDPINYDDRPRNIYYTVSLYRCDEYGDVDMDECVCSASQEGFEYVRDHG